MAGAASRLRRAGAERLRGAVEAEPDANLEELREVGGVPCSIAATCRAKKSTDAAEQARLDVAETRAAWRAGQAALDPSRLVFVDEGGSTTAMARAYGRAPRGRRVVATVPHGQWKVVTLTAALRQDGVGGCLAFVGGIDATAFGTYAERVLALTFRPGDIVALDNLGSHERPPPIAAIEAAGAEVRSLPPYSPDLDPIEKKFAKLKAHLRSSKTRTIESL